jgi:hypothetical protein
MAVTSDRLTTLIYVWTLDLHLVRIRAWVNLITMRGAVGISHQGREHAVFICEEVGRAVELCYAAHVHHEHLDWGGRVMK